MTISKRWIMFLIFFGIVALLDALFYAWRYAPEGEGLRSYISTRHAVTVAVVNLNDSGDFSQQGLLNGDDAILVINRSTANQPNQYDLIRGISMLRKFDINRKQRIDNVDPVFASLELLYFSKDENGAPVPNVVSLQQAGIASLYLYKKSLDGLVSDDMLKGAAGGVMMTDGTFHIIKDASIEQDILSGGITP